MMKFLLNQGLPRSTVAELIDRGFDAVHVGQQGMEPASDEEILAYGRDHDAVVVTLDAYFHALLAAAHATNPSTIRIEGLTGARVANIIEQVFTAAESELTTGAVVSVTNTDIRVRLLPLV